MFTIMWLGNSTAPPTPTFLLIGNVNTLEQSSIGNPTFSSFPARNLHLYTCCLLKLEFIVDSPLYFPYIFPYVPMVLPLNPPFFMGLFQPTTAFNIISAALMSPAICGKLGACGVRQVRLAEARVQNSKI